ncbi:MAG: hypothetical protein KDA88_17560 [Planctomycetaceae bacterium]|nr:hypothetical protein [Planctomycetaceae bacterium]MCB9952775.1 hypothetical protein [Planctomycetaceae bacterium]
MNSDSPSADSDLVAQRFPIASRMLDVWYAVVPPAMAASVLVMVVLDELGPNRVATWWLMEHQAAFYAFFALILAHNLGLFFAIILVWRSPFSTFDRWKITGLLLIFHVLIQPLWRFILVPAQADESRRPQALTKFYRWSLIGMAIWTLLVVVLVFLDSLQVI